MTLVAYRCRSCGYCPAPGEDRNCPARADRPPMFRGHDADDFDQIELDEVVAAITHAAEVARFVRGLSDEAKSKLRGVR